MCGPVERPNRLRPQQSTQSRSGQAQHGGLAAMRDFDPA